MINTCVSFVFVVLLEFVALGVTGVAVVVGCDCWCCCCCFLSVVAVKTVVDSCCCFCFCGDALSVGGVGGLGECLVVLYILQALALNLNSFP